MTTYACLPNEQLRAQGEAILRVAAELRDFLAGEDVPASLLADLGQLEQAGRWLSVASSLDLSQPIGDAIAAGPPSADACAWQPWATGDALPWTCS